MSVTSHRMIVDRRVLRELHLDVQRQRVAPAQQMAIDGRVRLADRTAAACRIGARRRPAPRRAHWISAHDCLHDVDGGILALARVRRVRERSLPRPLDRRAHRHRGHGRHEQRSWHPPAAAPRHPRAPARARRAGGRSTAPRRSAGLPIDACVAMPAQHGLPHPLLRRPCAPSDARCRRDRDIARGWRATRTPAARRPIAASARVRPIACATRASSRMKRLLPTPGNPAKNTIRWPRAIESSAASRSSRLAITRSPSARSRRHHGGFPRRRARRMRSTRPFTRGAAAPTSVTQ